MLLIAKFFFNTAVIAMAVVVLLFANPAATQMEEIGIDPEVLASYWDFVGFKREKDIEKAHVDLQVFMLEDPEKGRRNLEYLRENGNDTDFNKLYEEAWVFVSRIRGDPVEAYRLSKDYAERGSKRYRRLWIGLRRIASKADIPEIKFDAALKWFLNPEEQNMGLGMMQSLVTRKYTPAYRELIRRYLEGDGAEKAPWLAYYWVRRGEKEGLDVGGLYPGGSVELFKTLDERGREWLHFYDARGEVPPPHFKPSS